MAYKNKEDQAAASKKYYIRNKYLCNKNRGASRSEKIRIISYVIRWAINESLDRHVTYAEIESVLKKEFSKSDILKNLYKSRGIGEPNWLAICLKKMFIDLNKELCKTFKYKYPESIESCGLFLGTTTRSLVGDFDEGRLKFFIPKKPRQDCKAELLILELLLNKERVWMRTN